MVVLLSVFFSPGGFTIVVSFFFSAGGLTVVVFCSQAARMAAPAKMQISFFISVMCVPAFESEKDCSSALC